MATVLLALSPVVLILLLGKALSLTNILSDHGWISLERATYFVLFPALIVSKLSVADFSQIDWRLPAALIGGQLVLAALTIVIARLSSQPRNRVGVFVQSGVRWNTFIALAIAQDLIGPNGVALVAAAAAAMIPVANVISILGLTHYADQRVDLRKVARSLALNPLVLACMLGILINWSNLRLPIGLVESLNILGQATIALGLLATGAAIRVKTQSASIAGLTCWSLLRLLGLPIVAGAIAIALNVSPAIILIILIATSVPTASNGTILARQLGADANLAANLIAAQTMLAIATITFVLWGGAPLI